MKDACTHAFRGGCCRWIVPVLLLCALLAPSQALAQTATTTLLTASANPATNPQPVTFTAAIQAVPNGAPVTEGTVQFTLDGATINGCGTVTVLSNGTATCTLALAAGSHTTVASFSGDANFAASTSGALTETVNAAVTATTKIATVVRTIGQNTSSVIPVQGSGGTAPLAYSIAPALPSEISFNSVTGAITSGVVATPFATTPFTVTITDANGVSASNVFNLAVVNGPTTTLVTASKALTVGRPANFTPVTGSGAATPITFSTDPTLGNDLSINPSNGVITGTPTGTLGATSITVIATDANQVSSARPFTLVINAAVSAPSPGAPVTLTQNMPAVTIVTPIQFNGGTSPFNYAISSSLPAGLSFSTTTGAITGSPTGTSVAESFTITATDFNGSSASNSFTLKINSAVTATQSIATKTLAQNQASTSFTPVTGSGGTSPLSYSISPALPAGLTLTTTGSGAGAISGSPSATLAATPFTVTVTDVNQASASNTFTLAVNNALTATTTIASPSLTQNQATTSFAPVQGSGGAGTLSYSISPTLPAGIALTTSGTGAGTISGSPTVTLAATTFTMTVTDQNSTTATGTFMLTVNAPPTASTQVSSTTATVNHAVMPFTPVAGNLGTGPLGYSIAPTLPAGLNFDGTSGQIAGTPTVSHAATAYTVTVTDHNNVKATNVFTLTVSGPVTATQAIGAKTLTVNTPITTPFTPVSGSGGSGTLGYTVSPTLPAGLTMNASTGAIAGSPTTVSAAATYTVTVTDANGATATATFSLAVAGGITATPAVASTSLIVNRPATSFVPVTAAGGTTPYSYAVSPALPAGLKLTTTSGAITGTPTVASPATTYTMTVTDANGATATATFRVTVIV